MKREKIAAAALFVLAVAAFAAAWRFPYINIDDPYYYVLSKEVTGGLSWAGIKWAFTDLSNAIWMPLTWLVYQVDYSIRNAVIGMCPSMDGFQLAYSIAHVQSILLHGLNSVLLFFLLRRIDAFVSSEGTRTARVAMPLVAAAIWAVHPLRVESVVWIASLKDVLSMTLLLAALIQWVKFREADGMRHYVLSHIALALACCAKPSVITFPGMVLLIDTLILRKFNPFPLDWKRYKEYAPSVAIAMPTALLAQIAQSAGGATMHQAGIPLWYRLLNATVSIGVYLRNLVWPSSLAPQCAIQWPAMPHFLYGGLVIGGAFIFAAVFLAWIAWRRLQTPTTDEEHPQEKAIGLVTTGVLWFAGTILPMLGISAFGGHAFADRFTYIPMVGVSIALLALKGRTSAFLAAGWCLCLGWATARQTAFWCDDGALSKRILEVDGDGNYLAHVTYAKHLFEHEHTPDKLKEAEAHFTKGYELNPDYCQVSTVIYMMLLGESGNTRVMDRVENNFIKWLHERRGIWRCLDIDVAEGIRYLYAVKRDDDPEYGTRYAKRIASELIAHGEIPAYQPYYFIYCVGKLTGDEAMRQYGIDGVKRLLNPLTGFDGWPAFRFILGEDGRKNGSGDK